MEKIVDGIINPIILLLFATGTFLFVWGLVVFLWKMDNPEGKQTGVRHMIWGILGVFIMASVLGIVKILKSTLGLS